MLQVLKPGSIALETIVGLPDNNPTATALSRHRCDRCPHAPLLPKFLYCGHGHAPRTIFTGGNCAGSSSAVLLHLHYIPAPYTARSTRHISSPVATASAAVRMHCVQPRLLNCRRHLAATVHPVLAQRPFPHRWPQTIQCRRLPPWHDDSLRLVEDRRSAHSREQHWRAEANLKVGLACVGAFSVRGVSNIKTHTRHTHKTHTQDTHLVMDTHSCCESPPLGHSVGSRVR